MIKYILIFAISILTFSCAPIISSSIVTKKPPIDAAANFKVYDEKDVLPINYTVLGELSFRDGGLAINCDFNAIIELSKSEAKKNGGNALQITKHILPNFFGSMCHQIDAKILFIDAENQNSIISDKKEIINTTEQNKEKIAVIAATNEKSNKFLVNASVGYSRRVAETPPNLSAIESNYLNELKSGYNYDFAAYYKFNKINNFYVGLKYSTFKSSAVLNNLYITSKTTGLTAVGSISDNITISTFGVSLYGESIKPFSKHQINYEIGLGYVSYEDLGKVLSENLKLTGETFGANFGLGYKYEVGPNFAIGPQINLFSGLLQKYTKTDSFGNTTTIVLKKEQFEGLARIDFSIGAAYKF